MDGPSQVCFSKRPSAAAVRPDHYSAAGCVVASDTERLQREIVHAKRFGVRIGNSLRIIDELLRQDGL